MSGPGTGLGNTCPASLLLELGHSQGALVKKSLLWRDGPWSEGGWGLVDPRPLAEPGRLPVPEQDSLLGGSFPTKLPVWSQQPCPGTLSPDSPPWACRRPNLAKQPMSSASISVLSEPKEAQVGQALRHAGSRYGDTEIIKNEVSPQRDGSLEKG